MAAFAAATISSVMVEMLQKVGAIFQAKEKTLVLFLWKGLYHANLSVL